MEDQRKRYLELLPQLVEDIKKQYPKQADQDEKIYNKTVNAKAFDIARAFLPAGCSTNLAWHTTLRQVADRILRLRHHPLEELREIAETLLKAVMEKYPHSFTDKRYEDTEHYLELAKDRYYYHNPQTQDFCCIQNTLDTQALLSYLPLINARPNGKTELPVFLDTLGTIHFDYTLDF